MRLFSTWVVFVVLGFLSDSVSASERLFRQWDTNKDEKVSKSELPANARRNFERVDTNNDMFISLQEHLAFLQNRQTQRDARVVTKWNLPYAGTENPRQQLDLYLPKMRKTDEPLPVIVFIHGGAWRAGNKSGGRNQLARFVASGNYIGVSVGYRLSGEARWPAQIHDCKAAIRWVKAQAKEYNLDPSRIGIMGTSAGGHLVAMLGTTAGVQELEGNLGPHTDQDTRVNCVVDFFGPANFLTMNDFPSRMDHNSPTSPESQLIGGAIQENKEKALAACPEKYITKDDAPILLIHGTKDPLVPVNQSIVFQKKLKQAGVEAKLITITDGGHGGFANPEIEQRVDQFFENQLRGGKHNISEEPIPQGGRRRPR